jgi:hypothetical protein
MRYNLLYGHTYRAKVDVDPMIRAVFTQEMVGTELQRYQLFGSVTETTSGYTVTVEFRGRSGTYELPAGVQSIEMIS